MTGFKRLNKIVIDDIESLNYCCRFSGFGGGSHRSTEPAGAVTRWGVGSLETVLQRKWASQRTREAAPRPLSLTAASRHRGAKRRVARLADRGHLPVSRTR